jgi:hypothetical protein
MVAEEMEVHQDVHPAQEGTPAQIQAVLVHAPDLALPAVGLHQ